MDSTAVVERQVAAPGSQYPAVLSEDPDMEDVGFHRVEERRHVRVVGHLFWPVHALDDARLGQALAEGVGGILDGAVGMEDQPDGGLRLSTA